MTWEDLNFWRSGEWQKIQERIDDMEEDGILELCPKREDMFNALDAVDLDQVKVCIIGQDPYPSLKHATGIAFSVPKSVKDFPPTLKNIFKEYVNDLHYENPTTGCLDPWVKQGVLLWNSIPTCYAGKPNSHRNWWEWDELTKEIVNVLSTSGRDRIVFVFWGGQAQAYERYVDAKKHGILRSPHPSPLSANRGFFGTRPFTCINALLPGDGKIDWKLP